MPHLSNAEYIESIAPIDIDFPSWWSANGGRLIQLESGVGTRVWLGNFQILEQPKLSSCDMYPAGPADTQAEEYDWYFWLYGAYKPPREKHCGFILGTSWLFYSRDAENEPMPPVEHNMLIGVQHLSEFRDNQVAIYITREWTQKMYLGFFYLGLVTAIPKAVEGLSPADLMKRKPKMPPLWFYLADTQANFHNQHHDVPLGKPTLCP